MLLLVDLIFTRFYESLLGSAMEFHARQKNRANDIAEGWIVSDTSKEDPINGRNWARHLIHTHCYKQHHFLNTRRTPDDLAGALADKYGVDVSVIPDHIHLPKKFQKGAADVVVKFNPDGFGENDPQAVIPRIDIGYGAGDYHHDVLPAQILLANYTRAFPAQLIREKYRNLIGKKSGSRFDLNDPSLVMDFFKVDQAKFIWYRNGKPYRANGPSIVTLNDVTGLYLNGHRLDMSVRTITFNWVTESGRTIDESKMRRICTDAGVNLNLLGIESVFLSEGDRLAFSIEMM